MVRSTSFWLLSFMVSAWLIVSPTATFWEVLCLSLLMFFELLGFMNATIEQSASTRYGGHLKDG
mgnify:CR=1 FL=1